MIRLIAADDVPQPITGRRPGWTCPVLLIDTYVAPSAIEGLGLFAASFIPKGTPLWKFDSRFDLLFERSEIAAFPETQRQLMERYSYPVSSGSSVMIYETDNGRFVNHSEAPNMGCADPTLGVALRDIEAGEEITNDYAEFWPEYFQLPGMEMFAGNGAVKNGHSSRF